MSSLKKVSSTAERLREAMADGKIKQVDLAKSSELDKSSISNYLAGRYEPKSFAIGKLAVALNVSEMWLWGYDVPKERTEGQKKNDQLVKIISRMRHDSDFAELVIYLDELDTEQYKSICQLLTAFKNK